MLRTPVGLALSAIVVLGAGTVLVGFACAVRGIDKACRTIGTTRGASQ